MSKKTNTQQDSTKMYAVVNTTGIIPKVKIDNYKGELKTLVENINSLLWQGETSLLGLHIRRELKRIQVGQMLVKWENIVKTDKNFKDTIAVSYKPTSKMSESQQEKVNAFFKLVRDSFNLGRKTYQVLTQLGKKFPTYADIPVEILQPKTNSSLPIDKLQTLPKTVREALAKDMQKESGKKKSVTGKKTKTELTLDNLISEIHKGKDTIESKIVANLHTIFNLLNTTNKMLIDSKLDRIQVDKSDYKVIDNILNAFTTVSSTIVCK